MEASDDKLKSLAETTGVDFIALKKKYTGVKAVQEKTVNNNKNVTNTNEKTTSGGSSIQEQYVSLDKYVVCKTCKGMGIIKEIYNHMVLDKTCPECEGDSIMQDEKYLAAISRNNNNLPPVTDNGNIETADVETLD